MLFRHHQRFGEIPNYRTRHRTRLHAHGTVFFAAPSGLDRHHPMPGTLAGSTYLIQLLHELPYDPEGHWFTCGDRIVSGQSVVAPRSSAKVRATLSCRLDMWVNPKHLLEDQRGARHERRAPMLPSVLRGSKRTEP
eukprot:scaffold69_cov248-Pinguiococcus_pyrenoidosus.AAC.42